MTNETIRIVVLGGGYAGIMAALRVAGKTKGWPTAVTLINALDYFVERPRLHEQAMGTLLHGKPIPEMLHNSRARFVQGWVKTIIPHEQVVVVDTPALSGNFWSPAEVAVGEQRLPYNYLINALGSRVDRQTVPGVNEYAYTLDPYGNLAADALHGWLERWAARPFRAIVVGGGATGIETAAQLKGSYPLAEVTILTQGEVGGFKGPRIQKHIQQALAEQDISVVEHSRVLQVESEEVHLDSGRLAADVVIWAGGFVASPLAQAAGIQVNNRHQMMVDPYLRSVSHPNIYAVGDMAAPVEEPGAPMRMALFTALVSGAQAADNIVAEIKGKPLRPLSFVWYGQAIAIGPRDAVGFATYPVDAVVGPVYRRRTAVTLRRFFVWFLKAALELERRFPGFLYWNGKKRFE